MLMIASLDTLFKIPLPKLREVFLNKALEVVQDSGMDCLAQDLCRCVPLLDDCIDECLLHHKRKVSRQLAGARPGICSQLEYTRWSFQFQYIYSPMSTL